jgi:hypothetical protein
MLIGPSVGFYIPLSYIVCSLLMVVPFFLNDDCFYKPIQNTAIVVHAVPVPAHAPLSAPLILAQHQSSQQPSASAAVVDIIVRTLTGNSYSFSLSMQNTLDELKTLLEQQTGVPQDAQRLLLHQQALEDEALTLAECGVQYTGTIISMTLQDQADGQRRRQEREAARVAHRQFLQPTQQQPPPQQQQQPPQGLQAQHVQPVFASPAIQNMTSPANADPMTLTEFCAQNKFGAFEASLAELGIIEASELEDVTDEQLKAIGFNAIQLKRLRKKILVVQSDVTAAMSQAVVMVDQSVDVSAPSSIGGSE